MSGMRLGKISVLVLMAACLLGLQVRKSYATPIKPDVREVLSKPTPALNAFPPARAGWDGPELPRTASLSNGTFEQFGPAGTARQVHDSLWAAFIPDYRALAGLMLVTMLLRRIVVTRRRVLAKAASNARPISSMPATPQAPERAA